jgi:WD40 repeat protein
LTEIDSFIVFALNGSSDLHYINSKRQFFKVSSHLQPINQVTVYRDGIATCSDDFTVRIWNVEKGQITQSKAKHAYFGHTGKVTCFEKYEDFLVSGSSDQTVIFWRKDENHCTFKSTAAIKNILACG